MKIKIVLHVLSVIILIISLFILLSAGIAFLYGETISVRAFLKTIVIIVPVSVLIFFLTKSAKNQVLGTKEGFMLVTASWIAASLTGALPFVFSGAIPSYTDAFFETMSGFTTTGASILTDIEGLSHGMLFWRSLTHWLGGMGIVVLTVALLPILGIGGVQLLRAEAPGPSMDKITPKVTQTAKILWLIYVGFTVLEITLLMFGGMSLFDASTHTFGTLATGGFSTKAASVGAFNSAYIHIVITVFMVLAGMNFNLYYKVLSGNFKGFFKDTEMRVYLAIFFVITLLISINLLGTYGSFGKSMQFAGFQVASILTTTGYATTDFALWPAFSKNALIPSSSSGKYFLLHLKYFLIKKGHNCIIGDKSGVYRYMINNPGGVYYDKSISINKISFIKKIKKIARHFVCSDEELGITYNNITYNNINYISINYISLLHCLVLPAERPATKKGLFKLL